MICIYRIYYNPRHICSLSELRFYNLSLYIHSLGFNHFSISLRKWKELFSYGIQCYACPTVVAILDLRSFIWKN
jgi:hypothetical protein